MNDEDEGGRASGLLSRLHNFYRPGRRSYEKEDLFTEYLAWLLNRSERFRIAFAEVALGDSEDRSPELFRDAVADTQVTTMGRERIDLVLDVDAATEGEEGDRGPAIAARLAVECKVDDTLRSGQLARYGQWLEEETHRCGEVALVALTKQRLGQQSPFDGAEPLHWQGRMHWHKVSEALAGCVKQVRKDRLPALDPEEEDEFDGAAGFVVIGEELRDLMREEGMMAATKIDAGKDADLYRASERYKERVDDILGLVENAIDKASIETLLRENGEAEALQTEHKKNRAQGRPVSILYHREDPPASFMFGVTVSPPNRYARRPGETFDTERYQAELIAAYKMHDRSGNALLMDGDLETSASTLSDAVTDRLGEGVEVFVPENASYQKFVVRAPVPAAESADEQAREMAEFFRAFVTAFVESDGPDGQPMLEHLRDGHLEAVGEE